MPPSPEVILQSMFSHSLISQYLPTFAQTTCAGFATSISIRMVAYSGSAAASGMARLKAVDEAQGRH